MERKIRKAINFDLDTNIMKDRGLYPNGYELLRAAFKKQGFEHRQGSGYLSISKLTSDQVYEAVEAIVKENLWLAECAKKIDVTDIGKQHDLTSIVKTIGAQYADESAAQQQAREERRAARSIAEPKIAKSEQQPVTAGMAAALERLKAMCPMYQLEVASGGKESADAKFDKAFKSKAPKAHSSDRVQRSDKARSRKKQVGKGKSNGKA